MRLSPAEVGNRMAQLGIITDGETWLEIVKLRNELVHEYPIAADLRFQRVAQAHAAIPFLTMADRRLRAFVADRNWIMP